VLLRLLGTHPAMFDQPADHNRSRTSSPRFAMHVNPLTLRHTSLQKRNSTLDILKLRGVEIDRRQPQLLDLILQVFFDRPSILLAHVDHVANPEIRKPRNIPL
jgi:hypothetical protein